MGEDATAASRSGQGHQGNSNSPLRIYTRVVDANEHAQDDMSPRPRETTNALLSSAFARPYDGAAATDSESPSPGNIARVAPRGGRHGVPYHPLPSHWREQESGSSGIGSPITPDSGGGDDAATARGLRPISLSSSQPGASSIEPPRSFHNHRDLQQAKARALGQSPVVSPRIQIGALREAFGSTSSLEWTNDRPGSTYSCQSIDMAGPGYPSEAQAESPLDIPAHGGRFPPPLSSMAARPGAMRGALTVHHGPSRHHPSASTSSSHYSYSVNSPPARGSGAAAQFSNSRDHLQLSQLSAGAGSPPSNDFGDSSPMQSEDIVRKYLGLQRRTASGSGVGQHADASLRQKPAAPAQGQHQGARAIAPSSASSAVNAAVLPSAGPSAGAAPDAESPGDESAGSIVFRRAVSSGDLPTLEGAHGGMQGSVISSSGDNKSFLTPDLVESPLEALVRRLTIELFQLYVNEDRKKAGKSELKMQMSVGQSSKQSDQPPQKQQQKDRAGSGLAQPHTNADEYEGFDNVDDKTRDGYIQQFRLGPSLRSGSSTPAVTMDGYFVPQNVEPAVPSSMNAAAAAAAQGEVRPRPRHRLVQRTWMEEALIKARRVSTIDENAEESILEALAQISNAGASTLQTPAMPAASSDTSKTPSPLAKDDLSQFDPSSSAGGAAGALRVAQRKHALQSIGGDTRGSAQRQASNEGLWPRARIDLSKLSEESLDTSLDPRPEGVFGQGAGGTHMMSPRGYYRARDPAAPHRKPPAAGRGKEQSSASSISPARASLLRAVGRRQSVRLQPGKGQIVVAETQMGTRSPTPEQSIDRISESEALPADSMSRAKRANSLPGLMQVPETREVSYKELQRKAARHVELKKSRKSRTRMVHRAERMVLGGSQPNNARGDAGQDPRKRAMHKRAGSRADMDQQLVKVELPPPVPLRVRREQVRFVPEPLIIVRQLAKAQPRMRQSVLSSDKQQQQQRQRAALAVEDAGTAEQKILRVHNQLLGAQAVLSRHNSLMRNAVLSKSASNRAGAPVAPTTAAAAPNSTGSSKALNKPASVATIDRQLEKNAVRKEALDVVMLDNALDDHMEDDEKLRFADARERRRRERRERAQDSAAAAATETEDSESGAIKPWRNARRRSTLRKKVRPQVQKDSQSGTATDGTAVSTSAAAAAAVAVNRGIPARGHRLLLHGPVFRIYSGIRARPDTYLFLFSDMLVVTTRQGQAASLSVVDQASMALMAPPSTDPNMIPTDSRFKVHITIPLTRSATALKVTREGGSKRLGEDDEAEERRLVRQEERIRRACHLFEKNTSEAVVYLINRDIIDPIPDTVAGFLYRCTALSRRQLGGFLGAGILGENLHENPTTDEIEQEKLFHRQIWVSFLDRCNIVGVPIDEALRSILFYVRLPNNPHSISVLLEIAALQWYAKNVEGGQTGSVYVPDSQDMAVKLAFAIMTLNTELHNPLLRSETQPETAYRELLLKFRASVVDDPAVAGKRKGNVLRKRDQPRVVTIMEVPAERLKAIYERVLANRLVTCSDARPSAPEFEVEWVRDSSDLNAPPLSDDQVEQEIEDVYSDPGFRDGVLFNASSDRLPAKFSIEPPAWLRVTIRIPEPTTKLSIRIRVLSMPADSPSPSPAAAASGGPAEVVSILPNNWLTFRASNTASFIIRPQQVGHFTLHFIMEGAHARYYHPIPSRTMVVEGAFMRQTVQVNWKRGEDGNNRARHMFGMDSQATKTRWVQCLEAALRSTADVSPKDIVSRVDKTTRSLASLVPQPQPQPAAGETTRFVGDKLDSATVGRGTVNTLPGTSSSDQYITSLQLLSTLGAI
ncbi:hypothetical protein LPJ53_001085 [Coemansia erecta]|uniref:SEC7 domain-containing protein n=1 Tax=Coemansia erecta TaxID=147472 RepID=A0A9W7Y509_9FUNG|nr:hypothetical protein LPJ53_001085 [Coemansia erecta]